MTSAFQNNKIYFEKTFFDNWSETPIQPAGEDWSAKTIDRWINPFYSPSYGSINDISNGSTKLNGTLSVVCWAKKDFDVMELGDILIDFISFNIDPKLFKINNFEVVDHAWNESNMVFLYIVFNIESYEGICNG